MMLGSMHRALEALLGPNYPGQNWSYPPGIMFFAAPFGQFGYLPALLHLDAARWRDLVRGRAPHLADNRLLAALMLSPAAMLCVISGQSSLITAAMLITIFVWLDRRPIVAGILIGLLTLKPQLGILFPVMLIASARWRVFASAAVTALALVAATALVFGPQVWIDFVTKGLPVEQSRAGRSRAYRDAVLSDHLHELARHRPALRRRDGGAALRVGWCGRGGVLGVSVRARMPIRFSRWRCFSRARWLPCLTCCPTTRSR